LSITIHIVFENIAGNFVLCYLGILWAQPLAMEVYAPLAGGRVIKKQTLALGRHGHPIYSGALPHELETKFMFHTKRLLTVLIVFAFVVGCTAGRGSDSRYQSEEQQVVGTIRLARTLDTDSTEVEDMIILQVYQLRSEDQDPKPDNFDEIESEISDCAVKDSTDRLKISGITSRIDTLMDKERFSNFVSKHYENCKQHILRIRIHKEKSKEPAHKLKIDQNKLQNCRSNILNLVNVL